MRGFHEYKVVLNTRESETRLNILLSFLFLLELNEHSLVILVFQSLVTMKMRMKKRKKERNNNNHICKHSLKYSFFNT